MSTMASTYSKLDDFFCNLNDKNVNALTARELSGFTCTSLRTITRIFRLLLVNSLVQVNPDNSLAG